MTPAAPTTGTAAAAAPSEANPAHEFATKLVPLVLQLVKDVYASTTPAIVAGGKVLMDKAPAVKLTLGAIMKEVEAREGLKITAENEALKATADYHAAIDAVNCERPTLPLPLVPWNEFCRRNKTAVVLPSIEPLLGDDPYGGQLLLITVLARAPELDPFLEDDKKLLVGITQKMYARAIHVAINISADAVNPAIAPPEFRIEDLLGALRAATVSELHPLQTVVVFCGHGDAEHGLCVGAGHWSVEQLAGLAAKVTYKLVEALNAADKTAHRCATGANISLVLNCCYAWQIATRSCQATVVDYVRSSREALSRTLCRKDLDRLPSLSREALRQSVRLRIAKTTQLLEELDMAPLDMAAKRRMRCYVELHNEAVRLNSIEAAGAASPTMDLSQPSLAGFEATATLMRCISQGQRFLEGHSIIQVEIPGMGSAGRAGAGVVRTKPSGPTASVWPLSYGLMPGCGFFAELFNDPSDAVESSLELSFAKRMQRVLADASGPILRRVPKNVPSWKSVSCGSSVKAIAEATASDPAVVLFRAQHGDSALIQWNDVRVLVDGGPSADPPCFAKYLCALPVATAAAGAASPALRALDAVLLTHGDHDHVSGLQPLLKGSRKLVGGKPVWQPPAQVLAVSAPLLLLRTFEDVACVHSLAEDCGVAVSGPTGTDAFPSWQSKDKRVIVYWLWPVPGWRDAVLLRVQAAALHSAYQRDASVKKLVQGLSTPYSPDDIVSALAVLSSSGGSLSDVHKVAAERHAAIKSLASAAAAITASNNAQLATLQEQLAAARAARQKRTATRLQKEIEELEQTATLCDDWVAMAVSVFHQLQRIPTTAVELQGSFASTTFINAASAVFAVELTPSEAAPLSDRKHLLFTGDASMHGASSPVVTRLEHFMELHMTQPGPPRTSKAFDYIDVPHHGSDENWSRKLLDLAKPKHVVVSTDGIAFPSHPGSTVMADIARYARAQMKLSREVFIHFTYEVAALGAFRTACAAAGTADENPVVNTKQVVVSPDHGCQLIAV